MTWITGASVVCVLVRLIPLWDFLLIIRNSALVLAAGILVGTTDIERYKNGGLLKMKIVVIEREIAHKLNVAKYESIAPTLRMRAELEEGDDPVEARRELSKVMSAEWNKIALEELRMVRKRRGDSPVENDSLTDLMSHFKGQLNS